MLPPTGSTNTVSASRRARATSPDAHENGRCVATTSSTFDWTGWPTKPMVVVNWCGHGQEFVPWPEKDGYWVLVPVVEAVAT